MLAHELIYIRMDLIYKTFDAIQKTQVLGSVLYVAAHPDDENTRLISYFSNARHYHTTYLSLTRGDGGQNLIGTEIGDLLGLIRTQELLRARSTDGGNQLFSRAIDFGYSKHPEETFNIWNKEEVLSDVIWAIRKVRPDIIVHRFDHRTAGTTHGHHTGSAILSYEAFSTSSCHFLILIFYYALGLFAPYLLRAFLLLSTPNASSAPRTI